MKARISFNGISMHTLMALDQIWPFNCHSGNKLFGTGFRIWLSYVQFKWSAFRRIRWNYIMIPILQDNTSKRVVWILCVSVHIRILWHSVHCLLKWETLAVNPRRTNEVVKGFLPFPFHNVFYFGNNKGKKKEKKDIFEDPRNRKIDKSSQLLSHK